MFSYLKYSVGFLEFPDLSQWDDNPAGARETITPQAELEHINYAGQLWIRNEAEGTPFLSLQIGWSAHKPRFLLAMEAEVILIGVEAVVYELRVSTAKVRCAIELESPFYGFIWLNEASDVLVVYETGLTLLSLTEGIKWQYCAPGTVSWPDVNQDTINFLIDGRDSASISLATGR